MKQAETSSTLKTEVPKHKHALEEKYKKEAAEEKEPLSPDNIGTETVDELPNPSGWRLLVLPFTPPSKSKGGLIYSQETLDKARIATTCGYVLKMGPSLCR